MCAVFFRENAVRINYALDPTHVCVDLKACTPSEAHEDAATRVGSGEAEKEEEARLKHEAGVYAAGTSDENFKFMENGFGDRTFDARVEFAKPFERPPFVFLTISGLDVSDKADLRIRVYATDIDRYGFVLNVATWSTTSVRKISVEWFAYSRTYASRGQIRSGRIQDEDVKDKGERVTFPVPFVNAPQIVAAVTGLESPSGRNTRIALKDATANVDDFEIRLTTPEDSINKWASASWLAIDTKTLPVSTGVVVLNRGIAEFQRFWSPPLGDREYNAVITFASTAGQQPPDFEGRPELILSVESIDIEAGTAPRFDIEPVNANAKGFTLRLKTWEDTRINAITIRYLAIKKSLA